MSARDIVLRVEHLTMRFGGLVAVEDLSFSAARREITALIGPNGAGKTTVFNCITSFYNAERGSHRAHPRRRGDVGRARCGDAGRHPAPAAAGRAPSTCWSACRNTWWRSRRGSPARSRTSACSPA